MPEGFCAALLNLFQQPGICIGTGREKAPMRMLASRLGKLLLGFLCLAVAIFAAATYATMPLGTGLPLAMKLNFISNKSAVYTHVFAAATALFIGPFQLSASLRRRFGWIHRRSGRIYLLGVLIGGVSALYLSPFAFGGPVAKLGFSCLALLWLYTGLRALLAIRSGAVPEHRRWMVHNVSLTFAAVTLRIYLPTAALFGFPFEASYPVIAWACWIPNLLLSEWVFNRPR